MMGMIDAKGGGSRGKDTQSRFDKATPQCRSHPSRHRDDDYDDEDNYDDDEVGVHYDYDDEYDNLMYKGTYVHAVFENYAKNFIWSRQSRMRMMVKS